MNEKDPKPPLEYRNYSDDKPQRRSNSQALAWGMINGMLLVGFGGCYLALGQMNHTAVSQPRHTHLNKFVVAFAVLAIVAGIAAALSLRAQRRRFALAGFLLGIAITCLLEGLCFSS